MDWTLALERSLATSAAQTGGGGEVNPFNVLFVVIFALFISWLAKRLYDKKHRK